jgi:hypothetical protein
VCPASLAAGAEHDLRGVLGARELHQRGGDVGARELVVGAAELLQQNALGHEGVARRGAQTVCRPDVNADEFTAGPGCHARGAANDVLAAGRAGDCDQHPLTGLPRPGDPVGFTVGRERFVDAVCYPHQGQLAQRAEVSFTEVVGERGVDLLGRIDVAVRHTPTDRLWRHVDEFDLVGSAYDRVGDRLALFDPGDFLDHVVHRLEVLDVQCGDHVDAGVEELVDVLPPLLVA